MTEALARLDEPAANGTALSVVRESFGAGTAALAALDDQQFERQLEILVKGRERLERIHRALMVPEVDYGVIPGTDKPTLLKPGAEKLCSVYRLVPSFPRDIQYGDGVTAPPITVVVECRLHLGALEGPVVGTGLGASTSWEKKHRYRRGERACPECGVVGSIRRSKYDDKGWYCWDKQGGCSAKFAAEDSRIIHQVVGDVENPDPYDLLNTLVKMAEKRAFVDATLRATASSDRFTQDLEELPAEDAPRTAAAPNGRPAQSPPPSRQQRAVQNAERRSYGGETIHRPAPPPGEAEELSMQAPGGGKAGRRGSPLETARGRCFAIYTKLGGDIRDDGQMRADLSLVLDLEVTSRAQLTADEWNRAAAYFEEQGLPARSQAETLPGVDEDDEPRYDDPFEDE